MIGQKLRLNINGLHDVRYLTTYIFANKKIGQPFKGKAKFGP
jgi:hypothetical protein